MAKSSLTSSKLGIGMMNEEGEDPMASLGNLMDVMLVFACGLILALIANWGVDLDNVAASLDESRIQPVEAELREAEKSIAEGDSEYTELGIVYLEESTGQLYVVSP